MSKSSTVRNHFKSRQNEVYACVRTGFATIKSAFRNCEREREKEKETEKEKEKEKESKQFRGETAKKCEQKTSQLSVSTERKCISVYVPYSRKRAQ